MSNKIAYLVIVFELSMLAGLACVGLALLAWRLRSADAGRQELSSQGQVDRALQLTLTATPPSQPTTPATPVPTSTVTATPDPRVMVADCQTLDKPGWYQLAKDLNVPKGDCLKVQSSDVLLDCAGHAITGTSFSGYGVIVAKYGLVGEATPANVEIRNCRVRKFKYGIAVESGKHLSIHDNEASDNYDDVDAGSRYGKFLGMTDGGGVRLDRVTDAEVSNNVTSRQAIGIDIRNSARVTVRRNTASRNSAWGINLLRTVDSQVLGNTVSDTVRQCTWGAGVIGLGCDATGIMLQDGSSNDLVADNLLTGQNGNGIFIKAHAQPCGSNNTITGNTIVGALYNSIELGFCAGNKINGNTMRDSVDAVLLSFAHDTEIKDNTIANMKNHGILSPNSHHVTVSGNHISNSSEGVFFSTESYDRNFFYWLPEGDYTSHDNCLCDNTLQSNSTAIRLLNSTHNRLTNNTIQGNGQGVVQQGRKDGNITQGN